MGRHLIVIAKCLAVAMCGSAILLVMSFAAPLIAIAHPSLRGTVDMIADHTARSNEEFGVFLDGWTKTPIPRKVLDGSPAEMFYGIPLHVNQAISLEKPGYAFIPKLKTIKVNYVRHLPFIDGFEYGVANWKWNSNPVTILSDKVIAGTAEKMITVTHKGFWRRDSLEYAQAKRREQGTYWNWIASKTGWYRSYLVNTFAVWANPGVQLKNAALTDDVYKNLRTYALKDGAKTPEVMRDRMKVWRANLSAEAAEAGRSSSFAELEQTAVNCFHVEGSTGAYWTAEGLYIPLGTKLPVYRGQIAQGPLRTFNVASGLAVMEYNKADHKLEIYFTANNYLNVLDPLVPTILPPTLYATALPGEHSNSIIPDSRVNTVMQAPSMAMNALYKQYMAMPIDYEYLFRDPAELCGEDQRAKWDATFRKLDFGRFVHGHAEKPSTLEALDMVRQMTNTVDCGTSYLQAQVKNSNAYDLMEAMGWGHFIMETPNNDTMADVSYKHWNDFTVIDIASELADLTSTVRTRV